MADLEESPYLKMNRGKGQADVNKGQADVNKGQADVNKCLKESYVNNSEVIKRTEEDGGPKLYKLKLECTASNQAKTIHKYDLEKVSAGTLGVDEKVILVVGGTGSGKSTFINAVANHVLGVQHDDGYRFKLVQESSARNSAYSQTENISSYTLPHQNGFNVPYTITLIDTPGFGDTSGLSRDEEIQKTIKDFFCGEDKGCTIDSLSAICFIVQASQGRLTSAQKFIFDSALTIFGKDVEENIFVIFTFGDTAVPAALNAVKEANIPCKTNFTFNNSELFAATGEGRYKQMKTMTWDMANDELAKFLSKVINAEDRSLSLTKKVLEEREVLRSKIQSLQWSIKSQVCILANLNRRKEELQRMQSDVAGRKQKFDEKVVLAQEKKQNYGNIHTYVCTKCERNCHEVCKVPFSVLGRLCCVIKDGKCEVCAHGCDVSLHKIVDYHYVNEYQVEKMVMAEYVKRGKTEEESLEEALKNAKKEHYANKMKLVLLFHEVRQCMDVLEYIALKPSNQAVMGYVDLLIKQEKNDEKVGWDDRVKQLEEVKEEVKLMQAAGMIEFDKFCSTVSKDESIQPLLKEIRKTRKVLKLK